MNIGDSEYLICEKHNAYSYKKNGQCDDCKIESLHEQLAQAEINFALEHDDKVELEHQLAASQKREAMLRDVMHRISLGHGDSTSAVPEKYWESVKLVREAIAAAEVTK